MYVNQDKLKVTSLNSQQKRGGNSRECQKH